MEEMMKKAGAVNWWQCVAVLEAIVIALIAIQVVVRRRKVYKAHRREVMGDAKLDLDSTIVSAFKSKDLLAQLKRRYHPDRFVDEDKKAIATYYYQEFMANQNNYKKLVELEKEVQSKLNI